MKSEIIYGQKPDIESMSYIELTLKDDNKLDVKIVLKEDTTVWHLIMKDMTKYEAFKENLIEWVTEFADDLFAINDFIQAEDIHEIYNLEYDVPAQDTQILVSIDEIDDYIDEVSTLLQYCIEGCANGAKMFEHEINPINPLGNHSLDYWLGVMATLNWITMGGEKHDAEY